MTDRTPEDTSTEQVYDDTSKEVANASQKAEELIPLPKNFDEIAEALGIPKEIAAQISVTQIEQKSQEWSGPLPPPSVLQGYNEMVPDAAERILRMAEKNQDQQQEALQLEQGKQKLAAKAQELTETELDNSFRLKSEELSMSRWGLEKGILIGAGVLVLMLAGAFWLFTHDNNWGGSAILGVGVLGVLGRIVSPVLANRNNPNAHGNPDQDEKYPAN